MRKIFSRKAIGKILVEIEKIKLKSIRIKNPHLHYTDDKKINTIHDINKYIKKGPVLNSSRKKEIVDILKHTKENISNQVCELVSKRYNTKPFYRYAV